MAYWNTIVQTFFLPHAKLCAMCIMVVSIKRYNQCLKWAGTSDMLPVSQSICVWVIRNANISYYQEGSPLISTIHENECKQSRSTSVRDYVRRGRIIHF